MRQKFTQATTIPIASICVLLAILFVFLAFAIPDDKTQIIVQKPASVQPLPEPKKKEVAVLGTATTTFGSSSLDRKHNIALGAERVSDITVQAGAEYSFLEHLGTVTEEAGYKKEYVISSGSTYKEAGGGVCQVSTTLFRAVVDAGLPVVERHGHGYIVSYYGAGLDATIYGPWRDLKFVNDTDAPIIVRSSVDSSEINFSILGVYDGRVATTTDIKISDIKNPPTPVYISDFSLELGKEWCTERAIVGMTTESTYIVEKLDGTSVEQIFKTEYKPWGKRCYMGVKIPKASN